MDTAAKGREGENKVALYIKKAGLKILSRNYRKHGGEIDLIAEADREIVFLEVKYWSGFDEMQLETIVNASKRKRIIRTAKCFLSEHNISEDIRIRFDVIYMNRENNKIQHYENAFTESGIA